MSQCGSLCVLVYLEICWTSWIVGSCLLSNLGNFWAYFFKYFFCLFLCIYIRSVPKSCPTLCDPKHCSLPGSSFHGIFQARMLEWVVFSFSGGSSSPTGWTHIAYTCRRIIYHRATREASSLFGTLMCVLVELMESLSTLRYLKLWFCSCCYSSPFFFLLHRLDGFIWAVLNFAEFFYLLKKICC